MKFVTFAICIIGLLSGVLSEDANGWTYADLVNPEAPCGAPGQQLCGVVSYHIDLIVFNY